jgi:hypothetical protein
MDGELYDVPFACLPMELLGDDTICHGKLTGAPNNSPLPRFNYYPGHFKRGPTEPAPHACIYINIFVNELIIEIYICLAPQIQKAGRPAGTFDPRTLG